MLPASGTIFSKATLCLFVTVLVILAASLSAAGPTENGVVSLQEVLEDVTRTNPAILEAIKKYESVLAERSMATSEYYPTIGTELSAGAERTDGVPTNDREENLLPATATLFARQNLYNGGKTKAYVAETDARIKAAAYEVLNVANSSYLESIEAYLNVVKSRKLLEIANENALTQERIMRQVREKTNAGFNRVSELYNSESRLVLAKGSYISRQQDLNQALAVFHRQFGRLLRAEQFAVPHPTFTFPDTVQQAVDVAMRTHPALKVAEYNIKTRHHTHEKSSAAYFPSLDLELKSQYRSDTGGEEGDTTVNGGYLTLNYTFFDGGFRQGAKARDLQSIRKEYQRSYIERRNVNETVRLAWNIMEAESFKKGYLSEHVVLSEKTLGAFRDEYTVGRRTLLDLLNMENEYTDAQLSLTESQFSYLVAVYRIMQATGLLLEEHDTGLRKMLNLPDEEKSDMEIYEGLDQDRDQDQFVDLSDQCDNSIQKSLAKPYGCKEGDVNIVGYPEENTQLTPYIAPREPQVAHTVSKSKIILEAKPYIKDLTDASMDKLQEFSKMLAAHPKAKILIEGYVASNKKSDANMRLSEQRAELVKQYLLDNGIVEQRIVAKGNGIEKPRADNDTRPGRKMNRRVEVSIVEEN